MTPNEPIVIIGGGHAGAQLCNALAGAGLGARVHLVCDEAELPYQRPPLSKAFLKDPQQAVQAHRAEPWYAEAGITLHRGDAVVAIDRAAHTVQLRSGAQLPYAQLVLATGAVARTLPALPATLANVAALRSAADALRLRGLLGAAQQLTVLGGGFIGLEIAATARALGKQVTVLESAPRLLSRSVSPELAEHVLATHRASGIDLRLGVKVGDFAIVGDRLASLSVDGQAHAVELLVMGIGAAPQVQLAQDAGLACDNGIVVDELLRTSDAAILALGDCASFPEHGSGRRLRLESVQNANDQARTALATLTGQHEPYRALPWFWSEQGSLRLQMAGLMPADGVRHRRPGATPASFSILHYVGDRLACVESVNAPLDHMAARKLLETGKSPAPTVACDPAVALKSLI
ncbi:FAD-dependent oxidoreductase [Piscinibacter sp.]|jgi:3-phenylpropionate/trans-cinnamate dioxygenase ferredoxin reductase subunit|uniref:NAD(P)/FAD-dependent oxidoreductase n=1 Tax=Piscinibacter sp. TaxID=1903157 RepID=UPI001B660BBC|nr:FAD-dependent oxidoreductase [Piscinibacter sp.]MBK7532276.1 FAD-dependent oxidoreductase [Piscinibacter sp.]MBP6542474.1 FAD-dependent oxidoreductase [Piscinibacter sp.]